MESCWRSPRLCIWSAANFGGSRRQKSKSRLACGHARQLS
ncbi:MAG: hypothetical protein DME54_02370 [Verrucomicrobia bacterium]|nr:MAG: hypothetical protein DMF09_11225 [Verrucomicrobiota bacterium]PYJ93676.1 MAG: hypothetical protein DME62_07865 [Verrucomicrobiota bacterium]PYK36111.1 MAG: hypothetical protein DME54_02370 [Verrucomicrobiota bacterium]PYL20164.1 MAG: hypothetical protein DMF41_07190 [Verrucomicrobiota bacterium]PYL80563.1 MAG: hypothetical protein DMF21_08320 [Verrucomicrobiota bacterium]